MMKLLQEILTYKRRYQTRSERKFINRFIDSVEGMKNDSFGNRYIQVGEPNGVMFSSHTDTVHARHGRQKIVFDEVKGEIFKDDNNPLGADDGAGMWLMLNMIKREVDGLYIFHRAEECGGKGSSYIAANNTKLLEGIRHAIAFDRCGNEDIITHQAGQRCCSVNFANALAQAFGDVGLRYNKEDTGIFTDTANYTHIIPECTNISVGYDNEHTAWETLDYKHLFRLLEAVTQIDWAALPAERDVTQVEYDTWDTPMPWRGATGGMSDVSYSDMYDFCYAYPEEAAEILLNAGVGSESIGHFETGRFSAFHRDEYDDDAGAYDTYSGRANEGSGGC